MATPVFPPTLTTNILVNTLPSRKIVYLPAASTIGAGRLLFVKDICGNAANSSIFLSTTGLDTLDNRFRPSTLYALMSTNFQAVLLAPDGFLNWMILQNYNSNVISRATSGFSPLQISGLQAWYDGNDTTGTGTAVANNTSVNTWVDKSGQARNAAFSSTAALTATNALNGLTVVRCNGNNNYLITYSTFPVSGYTIYTVQTSTNNTTFRRVIHAPAGLDAAIFLGVSGSSVATFTGNLSSWNDTNANSPNISNFNTPRIVGMWVSGSTLTPYVDGTAQSNKTGTTAAFSNLNIAFAGGQGWVGDIAEILIFSTALATTPRQQIEGYLAWKWGLQGNLPAGHPYKNAPP